MVNSYDIAILSEKVAALEAAIKNAGIELPEVTEADNGATLQVVNGAWATGAIIPGVINNLNSDSTTDALSAAQGKTLNAYSGETLGSMAIKRTGFQRIVQATYGLIEGIVNQTLAEGDKPITELYTTCNIITSDQSSFVGIGVVKIASDGTIEIKLNNATATGSNRAAFTLTYFVN